MELSPATTSRYVHLAVEQMLAVADRLGDARANERPVSAHTNSVAGLIRHCCGVTEFWLGHVGVGRPTARDRDAEFTTPASVAELHEMAAAALRQVDADLEAIDAGASSPHADGRAFLVDDDRSDASLVLHVIEELFQHLGHCEIAADALLGS